MSAQKLRALVALDPGANRDLMEAVLALEPGVETVGVADQGSSWQALQRTPADVLVVACDGYSESALALIAESVKEHPGRPVVVLHAGIPNGFLPRVFEVGADDIVAIPPSSVDGELEATRREVLFSLEKAVARKRSLTNAGADAASVICVLGPKGGTGKTLTATNLAVTLAEMGRQTVVVDLDLQFGDVGLALGLRPERTIYDLATSSGSLDAEKLEAFLAPHPSGARVLVAPMRPDQASSISGDFLRDVYSMLRATNHHVIVDTPPGFTPDVIAAIDNSTDICVVGTLDALSVKNLKLGLETLDLMGYDRDSVRVVLNRADSRVGLSPDDVTAILGRRPNVFVPSHRDIARSMSEGTPISLSNRRSDAARAFGLLARMYAAGPIASPALDDKPRRGRRLIGGRA